MYTGIFHSMKKLINRNQKQSIKFNCIYLKVLDIKLIQNLHHYMLVMNILYHRSSFKLLFQTITI